MYVMEIFFVMAIFFVFVTLIFLILCFFFPEWVGITGKKALEVIEHQRESTPSESKEDP
jgi:hypothetical protein